MLLCHISLEQEKTANELTNKERHDKRLSDTSQPQDQNSFVVLAMDYCLLKVGERAIRKMSHSRTENCEWLKYQQAKEIAPLHLTVVSDSDQ